MHMGQNGFICGLALVCCAVSAPKAKPERTPEAKWTKGIADDFWKAFLSEDPEAAMALLSPELANYTSYVEHLNRFVGPGPSVSFDGENVAPDRSEVVFRGRLSGKNYLGKEIAADFTMRIAREGAGGKWSIRFLLITDRKEAKKKR